MAQNEMSAQEQNRQRHRIDELEGAVQLRAKENGDFRKRLRALEEGQGRTLDNDEFALLIVYRRCVDLYDGDLLNVLIQTMAKEVGDGNSDA